MHQKEAEDIKKRWQEYTEKLYKNDLHDPDNHNGVITHLEPDILEREVKWALGTITMNKTSGGKKQNRQKTRFVQSYEIFRKNQENLNIIKPFLGQNCKK